MSAVANKVDMSLDDIIKISKSEKRKQANAAKRQGRGGVSGRGGGPLRGQGRGRGRGSARGRGKSVNQTLNRVKQLRTNLQRGKRGRGQGRGVGINRRNSNLSPLNRNSNNKSQQILSGRGRGRGQRRGRGRGRGMQRNQMVFTNSSLQSGQQFSQSQQDLRRQRLDQTRQQAALLREKQLALENLQRAQKNIRTINQAIQKTSRENVVNQMRGINNNQTQAPAGRGRGRRKLLANFTRQTGNNMNNNAPVRQLSHTSVTITNPTALSPNQGGAKKRRWRRNKSKIQSEHFTIQVANENLSVGQEPIQQPSGTVLDQLKMLKPAVATTYKFQKNVFAAPATGVSLSDRFSGATVSSEGESSLEGRKVFV